MPYESYAESVRAVVVEHGIEVISLDRLKELVLVHRQKANLLRPDDFEFMKGSTTDRKWEHRTRSALIELRRNGECALVDRAKYRFFL